VLLEDELNLGPFFDLTNEEGKTAETESPQG
jgi:hypothetical protein